MGIGTFGSFENKLVSSSFKWVPKYILFLAKLKGERRPFWSIDLSSKLSLTCGGNVNYYKSVHHPHPGNFQNKSVNSPFSWMSSYILFLAKLKRRGRPFLEDARRGTTLWDFSQEHLVVIWDKKVSPFVKFEVIIPLPFLLDPLSSSGHRSVKSKESCCQQGKGRTIT